MPESSPERRRVLVRGIVQGVGFRAATARWAREAGVSGWVRNRPDGTVEAVLEGPAAAVEAVLARVRRGPPAAVVDRAEERSEPPAGERGFRIE